MPRGAVGVPEPSPSASPSAAADQEAARRTPTALALTSISPVSPTVEEALLPSSTPHARDTSLAITTTDLPAVTYTVTVTPHFTVTLSPTSAPSDPLAVQKPEFDVDVSYADRREIALRRIPRSGRWPGKLLGPAVRETQSEMATPEPTLAEIASSTLTSEPKGTATVDEAATATEAGAEARATDSVADQVKASPSQAVLQDSTEPAAEYSATPEGVERTPLATVLTARAVRAVTTTARATHDTADSNTRDYTDPRCRARSSNAYSFCGGRYRNRQAHVYKDRRPGRFATPNRHIYRDAGGFQRCNRSRDHNADRGVHTGGRNERWPGDAGSNGNTAGNDCWN